MRNQYPEPSGLVVVSALPLFYGASGWREALLLAGAVVSSVLILEVLLLMMKRLWFRTVRPLFTLIILASVLKAVFLVVERVWPDEWIVGVGPVFPLTLVSGFLLASSTASWEGGLGERFGIWLGFFVLLFVIGLCREWSGPFRMFPPAAFWIAGMLLAIYLLSKRRMA